MDSKVVTIVKWVFFVIGVGFLAGAFVAHGPGQIVLLILGLAFGGVGGGLIAYGLHLKKKEADLRQNGQLIQAEIKEVEINGAIEMNGANPWRVVAHWLNTASNELFVFKSANLWFDPTDYLKGSTIPVFIDPTDPTRYHVDLSGLPKVRG